MNYDVIIIGAGPAGIFTALTLAQRGIAPILLLEQGKDLKARSRRDPKDRLCGWGGAGSYSDGKLTLSTEVGGALKEFLDDKTLFDLLAETDEIYVRHGAPDRVFGRTTPELQALGDRARRAGMELLPSRIRHIGTENCRKVLEHFRKSLAARIEIRTGQRVHRLLSTNRRIRGVELADGRVITGRFVVAAPGRSGAGWMKTEADRLGLHSRSNAVDIGLRVELPAAVLKDITDTAYESKLIYYTKTFDEKVRTFCMNPYGEVVAEEIGDVITINGHSYAGKKSANTNFAVLVSSEFTEPFDDPIAYGLYIARLANLLGGGAIIQRLGDLLAGRRSTRARLDRSLTRPTLTSATPGDLSFVFPYRHLLSIIEMLQALDKLAPGVYARHTLLYGVEVKFYSNRIQVSPEMETEIENLFAIGDGAGITRGLLQASASGILAARAIAGRMENGSQIPV
ncbi:MAG: FAD-dependent oxidoreductase [Thermodesulfobacteriota bacterium]